MASIYVENQAVYYQKVKWVVHIISQYLGCKFHFVEKKENADVSIGSNAGCDIQVDIEFFYRLNEGVTQWQKLLPVGPVYQNAEKEDGLIETIFYLVNCVQELNADGSNYDQYRRFKFSASLQSHYDIIERNFVGELIERLVSETAFARLGLQRIHRTTAVFLSHDIDLIVSGWKIESYLAAKSFQWKQLGIVARDFLRQDKFYNNIEEVVTLDQHYGYKSCFYWLPVHRKDENGIMNADYHPQEIKKQSLIVANANMQNGLHKSTFSTKIEDEIERVGHTIVHNRYHYLKHRTHEDWQKIEIAGLHTEASLGFAERIGFRNSYALPFTPFNMKEDRPYNFVIIPLHIMDVTLFQYMDFDKEKALQKLVEIYENNKSNAILSILWHNNMLTNWTHKDKKEVYVNWLTYCKNNMIPYVLPDDIYTQFKLSE